MRRLGLGQRALCNAASSDTKRWMFQRAVARLEAEVSVIRPKELKQVEIRRARQTLHLRQLAEEKGLSFQVNCAAVIERLPVVMPDIEEWEIDMLEMKEEKMLYTRKQVPDEFWGFSEQERKVRTEDLWAYDMLDFGTNGRLGQWQISPQLREKVEDARRRQQASAEKRRDFEEAQAKKQHHEEEPNKEIVQKSDNEEPSADGSLEATNLDFVIDDDEDEVEFELNLSKDSLGADRVDDGFRPEPRITHEDETHDTRSVRRRLQRRLHLIVQVMDHVGPKGELVWRYPFGERREDEEMYAAAKRHLLEQCGPELDIYMLTRLPAGYTCVEYPDAMKKETGKFGEMTFFYRGQRITEHVDIQTKDIVDYAWISNDELHEFVPDYLNDPYWKYGHLFMDD